LRTHTGKEIMNFSGIYLDAPRPAYLIDYLESNPWAVDPCPKSCFMIIVERC